MVLALSIAGTDRIAYVGAKSIRTSRKADGAQGTMDFVLINPPAIPQPEDAVILADSATTFYSGKVRVVSLDQVKTTIFATVSCQDDATAAGVPTAAPFGLSDNPNTANALNNPGFETGDLTGWTTVSVTGGSAAANSTAPNSGTYRCTITTTGVTYEGIVNTAFIPVTAGQILRVTVYAKILSGAPGVNAFIYACDAGKGYLSTVFGTSVAATANYSQLTFDITVPAATFFVRVGLGNSAATASVAIDDVQVDNLSNRTTYGFRSLKLQTESIDGGQLKTKGTAVVFQPGLYPGQNILITSANYGLTAQQFTIQQVDISYEVNSAPVYTVSFGDPIVRLANVVARIPDGYITTTMISDGAISTPKIQTNAVTTLSNDGATVVIDKTGITVSDGALNINFPGGENLIPNSGFELGPYVAAPGSHTWTVATDWSTTRVRATTEPEGTELTLTASVY